VSHKKKVAVLIVEESRMTWGEAVCLGYLDGFCRALRRGDTGLISCPFRIIMVPGRPVNK
jgi:hypothetical protein